MKKIIFAVLFLIGISYAINIFLMRKYKKENEELLQYVIKQERLNILLSRNAIARHRFREFSSKGMQNIDSLVLVLDSMLKIYPTYNLTLREKFRKFATYRGNKDTFDFASKYKNKLSKPKFELEILRYINSFIDENYKMIVCGSPNLIITPNGFSTPLGVPLPFYTFTYFGFISPKEIKNLKNYSLDTSGQDPMVGYFPANKIGTYQVSKLYYVYNDLGGFRESYFDPIEYTVTEPDIRTTLVDKNYLNLNQDNRVSFNFGRYKSQDIEIAVEGGTFSIVNENTYNIRPTNKKVKIKYSLKNTNNHKALNLGYKEYEAK